MMTPTLSTCADNWRNTVILRLTPGEWHKLSDLFEAVEIDIPLHLAMRHTVQKREHKQKEVTLADLDVTQARWHYFTSFVLKLTHRRNAEGGPGSRFAKRSDQVSLKASGTCGACGEPTYLAGWPARNGRKVYACPRCTAAPPERVRLPEPELPPPEILEPEPPVPEPVQPPPVLKLPAGIVRIDFHSLGEAWEKYAEVKNATNPKLLKHMRKAFEAGILAEDAYLGVSTAELQFRDIDTVLSRRANTWAKEHTSATVFGRWEREICDAYVTGAAIVMMYWRDGGRPSLTPEITKLAQAAEAAKPQPRPGLVRRTVGRFLSPRKVGWAFRHW